MLKADHVTPYSCLTPSKPKSFWWLLQHEQSGYLKFLIFCSLLTPFHISRGPTSEPLFFFIFCMNYSFLSCPPACFKILNTLNRKHLKLGGTIQQTIQHSKQKGQTVSAHSSWSCALKCHFLSSSFNTLLKTATHVHSPSYLILTISSLLHFSP